MPQKHMECFRLFLEHLAWIEHQFWHKRFKEGRESVRDDERCGRKSIDQSWLAKGLGLGLRVLASSVGRGQHSSNRVSGISTRTMHQSTTPSLSQTISPRWVSKTVPQPPYSPNIAPCDFCLFPKLRGFVMRQLRRWKKLWWRPLTRSHKRTSMEPSRSCWNSTTVGWFYKMSILMSHFILMSSFFISFDNISCLPVF